MPSLRPIAARAAQFLQIVLAGAAAAGLTLAAFADDVGFGPDLGAPAPHPLALTDQSGAGTDLATILADADKGAVVYFSRSLSWCPVCIAQAAGVHERLDAFAERGYAVVIVTTDTPDTLATYASGEAQTATLLADPERAAIAAFDIRDPAFADKKPGSRAYALPYPSVFVVDKDGAVAAKLFEAEAYGDAKGYRARVSVDDVLAELDALADAA